MALPSATKPVSKTIAFNSVMIGLAVNYLISRVGELVRAGNLSRHEKLPYAGVFGTIVTERVMDVGMLGFGIVLSLVLLSGPQRMSMHEYMIEPAISAVASLSLFTVIMGVVVLALLLWWLVMNRSVRNFYQSFVSPTWATFKGGMAAAHRSPRRILLVLTTLGIWFLYALMAYIPLQMFDMTGPYNLDLVDSFVIMFLGALGIIVPTPGGAGSFHYVTVLILTVFYSVAEPLAATYAVFVHGSQLVLYLAVGVVVLAFQDANFSRLRSLLREQPPDEPPAQIT